MSRRVPALVNHVEPDNPREPYDCAIRALACYSGETCADVIRVAARVVKDGGKNGLTVPAILRIAALADMPLRVRRTFDPHEDYGIVVVGWKGLKDRHAAVLRDGIVIDRQTVWPWDAWHNRQTRNGKTSAGVAPIVAWLLVAKE